MSTDLYLNRSLYTEDKNYSEATLLDASCFLVVLAEPGAGKTCLMKSLAQQLGTTVVTANRFVHTGTVVGGYPLLIDAYDELAKVDASGIYKLLEAAHAASPTKLVISSRSSEWDNAANSAFQEYFGEVPLVARLLEFTGDEQCRIFEDHIPNYNYLDYHTFHQ